jgi:hypothetical protein
MGRTRKYTNTPLKRRNKRTNKIANKQKRSVIRRFLSKRLKLKRIGGGEYGAIIERLPAIMTLREKMAEQSGFEAYRSNEQKKVLETELEVERERFSDPKKFVARTYYWKLQ